VGGAHVPGRQLRGRENRISFYSFNLTGGLGAGSYFQDTSPSAAGFHYARRVRRREHVHLQERRAARHGPLSGYSIVPGNGTAPVRIGTRDFAQLLPGIGGARRDLFDAPARGDAGRPLRGRRRRAYDAMVLAEPSLVGYWRLDDAAGTVAVDARGGHDGSYQRAASPSAAPPGAASRLLKTQPFQQGIR
jgi:hypothetical protein